MSKQQNTGIVITKDTAIHGNSVAKDDVLLVPQDCSEDDARELKRMKRAKDASDSQIKKRHGEYLKEQEKRQEKEEEERKAAKEAAKAEMDELAKAQQEILDEAKTEAKGIVNAAKEEARQIIAAASGVAGPAVMRAKMELQAVDKNGDKSETLKFSAVGKSEAYPDDGLDEDNTFATFTPSAELTMLVNNPALAGKLKKGETFYLDFTKATKAKTSGNK